MPRILASAIVIGFLIVGATTALAGSAKHRLDNDLIGFTEDATKSGTNGPGGGGISGIACVSTQSGQPSSFAGNALLDCDSVGPHNETTIAVNPTNPKNIVAASHTYLYNLDKQSAIALLRIFTEAYVSKDGGQSWTNVHPPHGSYRFLTDPALAFDADGHLYWSNVASHDSVAGAFSDVSVIVERSDDGGITWTDPVTVAKGNGTVSNGGNNALFNDKDWIAVDRGTSAYRGSIYVTWARQQYRQDVQTESPIYFVRSRDGGATWSPGSEISGSSPLCSGQGATGPTTRCDQNDAGFSSPIVAPDGTIYVAFLNHQAQGITLRDQVLLVRSSDGGETWSDPQPIIGLIHDGAGDYPTNWRGDSTLTGCKFRIFAAGNLTISTAPQNAGQLYYVYAENLTPRTTAKTNIMVTTSKNGGSTWSSPVLVSSSSSDQIFPWAAVDSLGRLRVGYVDRNRAAPAGRPFAARTRRSLAARERPECARDRTPHWQCYAACPAGRASLRRPRPS